MVSSQLDSASQPLGSSPTAPALIEVQGLHKRYGRVAAVQGIDFSVAAGEIFGLIGPDGAGKTTTFHILGGILEPSLGTVAVLGQPPRAARPRLGYLTQQFSLYLDLSVEQNLRYIAGLRQVSDRHFVERRDRYLGLMNLEDFRDRLAGQLSGGMKQKLALCCSLIYKPEVLLLDEPTTGVDPVSRREFWDVLAALASEGVTIVVATPYLDEAERCHRVALMYGGQIQQLGTPAQIKASLGLHRLEVRSSALEQAERVLREVGGEWGSREWGSREWGDGEIGGWGSWGRQTGDRPKSKIQNPKSEIVDVQPFGDRLDVLVKDEEAGAVEVHRLLDQAGLSLDSVEPSPPTLENVFVARLRQQGLEPPLIPFPRSRQGSPRHHDPSESAIYARRLNRVFGTFWAVKDVDVDVRYGEIFGLLGANGAGKTTLIKMLCGLLEASSGDIALGGETGNLRSQSLRRRLGYMSQKFTLYDDLTILQNLEFYAGVYGIPRHLRRDKIAWVLASCGLEGQAGLITGQLPGGWKQRVAFGAAVMHEPEILFLDEPTSGVDPLARRQFWQWINGFARQGTAVLVTTHYLEEAEQCHRLCFMVAGEMALEGSPSQIKAAQPGQLIEVVSDRNQVASELLKAALAPWRVSIFADGLHVVVDDPALEIPKIRELLRGSGLAVQSLRPIPYSLEDAFIGTVQRADRGEP